MSNILYSFVQWLHWHADEKKRSARLFQRSLNFLCPRKFTLSHTMHSFPTFSLFQVVQTPYFFAQTPSCFAQPSTFARLPAAPRISGGWNAPVQMEATRCFVYNCCLSLGRLWPQRTQRMADNYQDWQSQTGWGAKVGLANVSSCWLRRADLKRLARSGGTSVTVRFPVTDTDAR